MRGWSAVAAAIYTGFTIFGSPCVYRGMHVIAPPRTGCPYLDQLMKTLWIRFAMFAMVLWSGGVSAAEEWPGLPFAEVRAYAWPVDKTKGGGRVIMPGMKLREDVINKDGAVLSPDQIKRLQAAVTGDHAEHGLMRCYSPHNAFIFYDTGKRPVAFVEICFDCVGSATEPPTAAKWKDFSALAKIFVELKLPMGSWPDLEKFNSFFKSMKRNTVR